MARFTVTQLEIERPEGMEIEMADGTVYALQNPKALPVEQLMHFEDLSPLDQSKAIVADGKFNEFSAHPEVDGYFFEAVLAKWIAHFGLGSPGEGVAS